MQHIILGGKRLWFSILAVHNSFPVYIHMQDSLSAFMTRSTMMLSEWRFYPVTTQGFPSKVLPHMVVTRVHTI